jgi:hypothetical protein
MYTINKMLKTLNLRDIISFDVETRSVYSKANIAEAKNLLKSPELVHPDYVVFLKQVARSSGLSFPSLIKTTHFIFGTSKSDAVVIIAHDKKTEIVLWNFVVNFKGKLLIHNAGFDLKICHQRTNRFPVNFEDTQLLAKCYINHCDTWKSKVGLKSLMGSYYIPKWSLFEDYDVKNLNNQDFLTYASIDGAATYYLYELLLDEKLEREQS